MNLSGNTVLITGGSQGIGFGMANGFLQRNNCVVITGRDERRLESARTQLPKLEIVRSDVTSTRDIDNLHRYMADKHPELNILVNNAGIMRTIDLQDNYLSTEELIGEIDVNLKSLIIMTSIFLPMLQQKTNAAIINVSSGLAFVPLPISPIYSATKAAVHSYTVSLRAQLRNTSVNVYELAPPLTKTHMIDAFAEEDIKGTPITGVDNVICKFFDGLSKDKFEIRPGLANWLWIMSRFFPNFMHKKFSRTVDRFHSDYNNYSD